MCNDIKTLSEKIREERETLEELATQVMQNHESLGENEEILMRSALLDELILQEEKTKKRGGL